MLFFCIANIKTLIILTSFTITSLVMSVLLLIIGLAILVKWADIFIDWASGIAKKLWISPLIIGLTIVAFWTSAPELFINAQSALHNHTDLALWNILWSNISNILLICWLAAALTWLQMDKIIQQNFAISLGFGVLIWILSLNSWSSVWVIWWIVLIIAMCTYMYYMFHTSRQQDILPPEDSIYPIWQLSIMITWGLLALIFGSDMVVEHAVNIAKSIWMSERVIWLTVIALWTSLPELMTTIVSIRKGQWELWVGNIVWSNIFNIGMIWAITGIIHPMVFQQQTYFDLFVFLWATILVLVLLFTWKKYRITKPQWAVFIILYITYIAYSIVQG